jgi:hypothetical protein
MAFRPNFTGIDRTEDNVLLHGESPQPGEDILDIRVFLAQEGRVARARVPTVGLKWDVDVPAADFVAGPAVAFGVETRRENLTTITWSETMNIPERPER